jgi:hypothetical protein
MNSIDPGYLKIDMVPSALLNGLGAEGMTADDRAYSKESLAVAGNGIL